MSRTILITGANRGIGFQVAKELAEAGHKVLLTGRDRKKVEQAADQIKAETLTFELDVTKKSSIYALVDQLTKHNLSIEVLVNNAGSVFDHYRFEPLPDQPFDTTEDMFRQSLELNVIGPYNLTGALFPLLSKDHRVDIINVSSGMGALKEMGSGTPAYRISKAALNAMTVWLAAEVKGRDVFVNSVCPGWVKTDLGGPNATREPTEGIIGIRWLVDEKPNIRGQFIRDKEVIGF